MSQELKIKAIVDAREASNELKRMIDGLKGVKVQADNASA